MRTILFHMTLKEGSEAAFEDIARRFTETTHAQDGGCISYVFYRRADKPLETLLYEQWSDADALSAHIQRLRRDYGPPDDDETLPERHFRRLLPKVFVDLLADGQVVRYKALLPD